MLDPAMMISQLLHLDNPTYQARPIFIPHYSTALLNIGWTALCDEIGIDYVSPEGESREVIKKIACAPLVLTESMHGAILADAYRTPWVAIEMSDSFNKFKWNDWAGSLNLTLKYHDVLYDLRPVGNLIKRLIESRQRRPNSDTKSTTKIEGNRQNTPQQDRRQLRFLIEGASPLLRIILKRRLKAALRGPSMLSEQSVLSKRQSAFAELCSRVADEYSQ